MRYTRSILVNLCMTLKTLCPGWPWHTRTTCNLWHWNSVKHVAEQRLLPALRERSLSCNAPAPPQWSTAYRKRSQLLVSLTLTFSTAHFKTIFGDYLGLYGNSFISLPCFIFLPQWILILLFTVCFFTLNSPRSSSPLLTGTPFFSDRPCRPL